MIIEMLRYGRLTTKFFRGYLCYREHALHIKYSILRYYKKSYTRESVNVNKVLGAHITIIITFLSGTMFKYMFNLLRLQNEPLIQFCRILRMVPDYILSSLFYPVNLCEQTQNL